MGFRPGLQGLRFLAASAIVIHHLGGSRLALIAGPVGMTLFFCLSGFVLTWTYAKRSLGKKYAIARFARIYPVFALFLVLDALLVPAAGHGLGELARHALLFQAWEPNAERAAYLSVSWSLSAELFFYALFPLLIVWLRNLGRRDLIALAVAMGLMPVLFAAMAGGPVTESKMHFLYYMPIFRLPDFILGCSLALLQPKVLLRYAVAAVALAVGCDLALGGANYSVWGLDALYLAPMGLLIVAVARSNVLSGRVWVLLGGASYALYLSHTIILAKVGPHIAGAAYVVRALVVFSLATAVSVAVFRWFEEPVRLKIRRWHLPHGRPESELVEHVVRVGREEEAVPA